MALFCIISKIQFSEEAVNHWGCKHGAGCQTEPGSNPAKPCFSHLQNGEGDNVSFTKLVSHQHRG